MSNIKAAEQRIKKVDDLIADLKPFRTSVNPWTAKQVSNVIEKAQAVKLCSQNIINLELQREEPHVIDTAVIDAEEADKLLNVDIAALYKGYYRE